MHFKLFHFHKISRKSLDTPFPFAQTFYPKRFSGVPTEGFRIFPEKTTTGESGARAFARTTRERLKEAANWLANRRNRSVLCSSLLAPSTRRWISSRGPTTTTTTANEDDDDERRDAVSSWFWGLRDCQGCQGRIWLLLCFLSSKFLKSELSVYIIIIFEIYYLPFNYVL